MRILFLNLRYWPARSGAEILLGELAQGMAGAGHGVTVATSDALDFELIWDASAGRVGEAATTHNGVAIRRFPLRHPLGRLPGSKLIYPGLRRLLGGMSAQRWAPESWLWRLAKYTPWAPDLVHWLATTDERFDLVVGMNIVFEPLLAAGQAYARRMGVRFGVIPLTHLGAGSVPGGDANSRHYTMRHQAALVRGADLVIAQTETERDFYVARGCDPARLHVIGPGIHPAQVTGGDRDGFRKDYGIDSPLVVFLGALSHEKGAIHLAEAARQLWAEGEVFELALAGDWRARFFDYWEALPQTAQDQIRCFYRISDGEKVDLLAAADIFAMPSSTDSFGIVYLEAWLNRLPVIGSTAWGMADVISPEEDGLLVPFGDVPALAAAIKRLLHDPETRARMGLRGEAKVYAQHTWGRKIPLIQDIFEE